jgi:hypothetical protein
LERKKRFDNSDKGKKTLTNATGDEKIKLIDNGVPGPGAYQPDIRTSKRVTPKYTIGRGKRPDLMAIDKNIPGPGTYFGFDSTAESFNNSHS